MSSLDIQGIVGGAAASMWRQYPMCELDDLQAQGNLIVCENIEKYKPQYGTLEGWLYHRVKYGLSDYIRRYVIKETTMGGMRVALEDDVEGAGMEGKVSARLDLADILENLDPKEYTIATMIAQGYTQQEVADEVGVTKQSISLVLKKMRANLREEDE